MNKWIMINVSAVSAIAKVSAARVLLRCTFNNYFNTFELPNNEHVERQ